MLIAAAVCPHPPVLIPAAMGEAGAGPELADLRAACAAAARGLVRARPDLIVIVGGGPAGRTYPWPSAGSLHRYGVPWSTGPGRPVLPLSLTVGTWLLTGALAASGIPGPAVTSATSVMLLCGCRHREPGELPAAWGTAGRAGAAGGDAGHGRRLGEEGDRRAGRAGPGGRGVRRRDRRRPGRRGRRRAGPARPGPGRGAAGHRPGPWQVLAGAAAAAAGQKDGLRGLLRHQAAPYDVSYLVASWAAEGDAAAVLAD